MGFLFDLKSRLKSSGIYIAFTLVIFYFGFYAFYGERGIRKYLYLRHEVEYARTLAKQYRVKKERPTSGAAALRTLTAQRLRRLRKRCLRHSATRP